MTKPTLKELIDAVFEGKTIQWTSLNMVDEGWKDYLLVDKAKLIADIAIYFDNYNYRIKPDLKVIKYRHFLNTNSHLGIWTSDCLTSQLSYEQSCIFKKWIGETQEVSVDI